MREPVWRHERALAAGVALGGLGTGSVEMRDDGRFHDWEIFGNYAWSGCVEDAPPEMWPEDAMFALRVRTGADEPRIRLLHHDERKTRAADACHDHSGMYTFPFLRQVQRITYSGQPPFALLDYEDDVLPVRASLEAFTPLVPHDAKHSGLPVALLTFRLRNDGETPCEASLLFTLRNAVGYDHDALTLRHALRREGGWTAIDMTADCPDSAARTAGSMTLAVLGEHDVTHELAWTDGRGLRGFDNPGVPAMCQVFYPLRDRGELAGETGEAWSREIVKRHKEPACGALLFARRPTEWRWRGALCRKLTLQPGQEEEVVFLMAWHFPNHYHYFQREVNLGRRYAEWFDSSAGTAAYVGGRFEDLRSRTRSFRDHLYGGTLPGWLSASLAAQLTTIPQSFWWTRDGDLAVWEGSACCQLINAAHTPWSSFLPLMLFPDEYLEMTGRLAREIGESDSPYLAAERARREAQARGRKGRFGGWLDGRWREQGYREDDFARPQRKLRTRLGTECAAVQLLRDLQWTGDRGHLERLWPGVRDTLEAQLAEDTDGDGLPDAAASFVTYDHWFLPAKNCYKCTMWLAELAAGADLARRMGDEALASACRDALSRGRENFARILWNGEYFDLAHDPKLGRNDRGCLADQVSGHLYLRLCGLDGVHDAEQVRSALSAVMRYNRRTEEGLLNGADPAGRRDWRYFARFSARGDDEALAGQWPTPWTGTEYYVAATMIAEGLVDEGLAVARDVYDRHVAEGMLYNHIECGEHYFRPLAAWAMLPALAGLTWDATAGRMTFAPKLSPDYFDSLFVLPRAWGRLRQKRSNGTQTNEIQLVCGELALRELLLDAPDAAAAQAALDDTAVETSCEPGPAALALRFPNPLKLNPPARLTITART